MPGSLDAYDLSEAVDYHYGRFPPTELDLARLIEPLARAQDAISRYDQSSYRCRTASCCWPRCARTRR